MKIQVINKKNYFFVAVIGWISKVISASLSIINTRLLIELFDFKGFAAYSVIISLSGWVALLNFGIGPAIQNEISKYKSEGKDVKSLLSLSFSLILLIISISIPLLLLITLFIKKVLLSNYSFISIYSLYITLFFLLLAGITDIYYKILFAEYRGYLSNIYPALLSLFVLMFLIILKTLNIKDFNILLICVFSPYLIIFFLSHFTSLGFIKPKFDIKLFKEVIHIAKKFFLFAILSNSTLNIDYIVMSKIINEKDISIYNINMKIFNFIFMFYNTILFALWPVVSEIFYKKQFKKIDDKIFKTIKIGIFYLIIGFSLIYVFKKNIFNFISGKNIIVSYTTIILTAIYFLLRIWTDTFAIILQSMNELNIFIKVVPIQSIISMILMLFMGKLIGINGILLGLIISFLLTVAWILPYKYYNIRRFY